MASSSQAQHCPRERRDIHRQRHPPDVEASICQIIYNLGSPNPKAFLRRWPLEWVLEGLTEVMSAEDAGVKVKNPAGMLWRILEEKDREQQRIANGGNE